MMVADSWPTITSALPLRGNTWPKPLIPRPGKWRSSLSDINYQVLRAGQEGIYAEHHMNSVDYSYRLRYFDKVGEAMPSRRRSRNSSTSTFTI